MNDQQIRVSFHNKWLSKHHNDSKTMVINELGLNHGKSRADIAIINGRLIGYEIKSELDSLRRLNEQIVSYNAVFDRTYLIATQRHLKYIGPSRQKQVVIDRSVLCFWAIRELGMSGTELSQILGMGQSSMSRGVGRGEKLVKDLNLRLID